MPSPENVLVRRRGAAKQRSAVCGSLYSVKSAALLKRWNIAMKLKAASLCEIKQSFGKAQSARRLRGNPSSAGAAAFVCLALPANVAKRRVSWDSSSRFFGSESAFSRCGAHADMPHFARHILGGGFAACAIRLCRRIARVRPIFCGNKSTQTVDKPRENGIIENMTQIVEMEGKLCRDPIFTMIYRRN